MNRITIKAYAKINLFLDITGRRENGYHELDSVMMSVGIADILTFEKKATAGFELICGKAGFPLDESNIICKAAKALLEKHSPHDKNGLRITVEKNIPSQAGMGGGSADGAAALIAVNKLYELGLDENELIAVGAKIGADVPFCIKGGCCICRGIGERLTEIAFGTPLPMVVIKPDAAISTPAAYKAYDGLSAPIHKEIADIVSGLERNDWQIINSSLFNAFEQVANIDEIESAKAALKQSGAKGVLMTGSGSAVFGLFDSMENAQKAYDSLKETHKEIYICTNKTKGTEIISEE